MKRLCDSRQEEKDFSGSIVQTEAIGGEQDGEVGSRFGAIVSAVFGNRAYRDGKLLWPKRWADDSDMASCPCLQGRTPMLAEIVKFLQNPQSVGLQVLYSIALGAVACSIIVSAISRSIDRLRRPHMIETYRDFARWCRYLGHWFMSLSTPARRIPSKSIIQSIFGVVIYYNFSFIFIIHALVIGITFVTNAEKLSGQKQLIGNASIFALLWIAGLYKNAADKLWVRDLVKGDS